MTTEEFRIVIKRILQAFKEIINKKGFTLTEVLLAVAIVGIIAALVVPVVVNKSQNSGFELKRQRQVQAINSVLYSLPVTENVKTFSDTMMYSSTFTYSPEDTAGKFLKKYFKIAKYCGAPDGNGASECFAPMYYSYSDKQKKDVPVSDLGLAGACAQLDNGTSICISPQLLANNPPTVVIDLNGPKGPNILSKDLIEKHSLRVQDYTFAYKDSDDTVLSTDENVIVPDKDNMCQSVDDNSNACCEYKLANNLIIKKNDKCCLNTDIAGAIPVCYNEATIHVDYYPTGGEFPGKDVNVGKTPYARSGSNTRIEPNTLRIPTGLTIKVKCGNGTVTSSILTSDALQEAIDASNGKNYYFTGDVYNTSCYYPKETLIWSGTNVSNGGKTILYKGLTYHLIQH